MSSTPCARRASAAEVEPTAGNRSVGETTIPANDFRVFRHSFVFYHGRMEIVQYLQIAVLALIQGAAELLPVSSSAHVILAQRIMGMDPSRPEQVFLLVMLHTGTMFAVLVYFWPRWRRLMLAPAETPGGSRPRAHFIKMIVLATVCTGVLGL